MNLSKDELRLILYWHERCHDLGSRQECNTCPLYSVAKGTSVCHKLTLKLEELFKKQFKETPNK